MEQAPGSARLLRILKDNKQFLSQHRALCLLIFVLGALFAWGGVSWWKSRSNETLRSENEKLTRERDKYEIIAKGLAPDKPSDKRVDFILEAVTNGFARIETSLVQSLRVIEEESGSEFLAEFPLGYGLFGVTLATNIVSLPFRPYGNEPPPLIGQRDRPWVKWPTLKSLTMDGTNYVIEVPMITLPTRDIIFGCKIELLRSVGVSLTMNVGEPGFFRGFQGTTFTAQDPCAFHQFSPNPKWSIVTRIVALKKHGPVMLLGVKQNPAWDPNK